MEAVRKMFECRNNLRRDSKITLLSNITRDNGYIYLEDVHPYFLNELQRKLKQWKDLIKGGIKDGISVTLNTTGYSSIIITPDSVKKGGTAAKKLAKLLLQLDTKLHKKKNLKSKVEVAMNKHYAYMKKCNECSVDTEGEAVQMSYLLSDEVDVNLNKQHISKIKKIEVRDEQIQKLFDEANTVAVADIQK